MLLASACARAGADVLRLDLVGLELVAGAAGAGGGVYGFDPELNDFDDVVGLELVEGVVDFDELPDENDRDGVDEDRLDELELDDRVELPEEKDRLDELELRDPDENDLPDDDRLPPLLPPFGNADDVINNTIISPIIAKRFFILILQI